MTPSTFRGTVDERGKLKLDEPERFGVAVSKLAGKPVLVSIKVYRPQRSNQQNGFYYGVVVPICAEEWGNDVDSTHRDLAMKFLTVHADPESGKPLDSVRSTASLTTVEFEKYIEDIRRFVFSFSGIRIPLPNEDPLDGMFT